MLRVCLTVRGWFGLYVRGQQSHHHGAELLKICNVLQTNDDNWKQRMKAIADLQKYIARHPDASYTTSDVYHKLHMGLETQVHASMAGHVAHVRVAGRAQRRSLGMG